VTPKSYPLYRESGVEWVRTLPESWKISALKRNTYIKGRVGWKGLTSEEFEDASDAYLVTGTDFRGRYIDWESCYQVNKARFEDDPFIQLRNGDLLITKDGTIGKTSLVDGLDKPACLNSGIFLVRPAADYVTEFLYWVLNSTVFEHFVDLTSSGSTIQHLYQNVFENFIFGFPDVEVQRQIADYLDAHTAKIDTLIGKQERLIEMLAERRQAVISHAVTKGLDPTVSMKDSGIYWLGEVPDTWTVIPLKRSLKFLTSGSRGWAEYYSDSGVPFIRIGNLPRGSLGLAMDDTQFVQIPDGAEGSRSVVREGDVLFSITAYLGSVAIVDSANRGSYVSQHVALARLNRRLAEPRFVGYFVLSESGQRQRQLQEQGYGGTKIQLSLDDIRHLVVTIPPIGEQLRIVEYLDRETAQIDALSVMAREMINVLKERRQALISAAVTGKIDVRGLA